MKLIRSLLDYGKPWALPDVYLFTGNPIRKYNGAIVMGRGAAKQVRDTYPRVQHQFGELIKDQPNALVLFAPVYGANSTQYIGWFKVKDHWQEPAKLSLVKASAARLDQIAAARPEMRFHINFPAVGNGKLVEQDIMPLINLMADNVIVYR